MSLKYNCPGWTGSGKGIPELFRPCSAQHFWFSHHLRDNTVAHIGHRSLNSGLHDIGSNLLKTTGIFSDLQRPKGSVLFHHLDDNHAHHHADEEMHKR